MGIGGARMLSATGWGFPWWNWFQIYTPISINVALGIGQLGIGKLFVWRSLKQSIALQCPMPNCQKQPFFNWVYIKHNLLLSVSKEVWISLEETLIEAN